MQRLAVWLQRKEAAKSTITIKQGDEYTIGIKAFINGAELDTDDIVLAEFTLGEMRKLYPDDLSCSNGIFHYPLIQEETFALTPGNHGIDLRFKFTDGEIRGLHSRIMLYVEAADSNAVLE